MSNIAVTKVRLVLLVLILWAELHSRCNGCPATNLTDQQLLEGNLPLQELYNSYADQPGQMALEELRELVTHLFVMTSCSVAELQDPKKVTKAEGHEYEEHDHSHETSVNGNHEEHEHTSHEHNHANEVGHELDKDQSVTVNHEEHNDHANHDHAPETYDKNYSNHGNNLSRKSPNSNNSKLSSLIEAGQTLFDFRDLDRINEEAALGIKSCDIVESVIVNTEGVRGTAAFVGPQTFLNMCPALLSSILKPPCKPLFGKVFPLRRHGGEEEEELHSHHHHSHKRADSAQMTRDKWIGAVLSMVIIGLIALACIMIIPALKSSRYYIVINQFLLALAVGTLAGDALIHLLPHALTMEIETEFSSHLLHALYGFTAFSGILLFLLMEKLHNLVGHKHSHDLSDGEDFIKEIGAISAELNENPQNEDKIGEKLVQLSKHSSFIYTDGTSPSEPRGCFESCPPNLGSGCEDANGNNGINPVICKSRVPDQNSGSLAECERLVTFQDKADQISSGKVSTVPIPPPPLVQHSPPKPIVRQDSKNFNMVLQEYHVGHHGHSHHGHSHVTGKKDSLRAMILLGDGMHTFMDGMAIGAAYGTSLTGGIATAIAVMCHELPHKVGDFAILFEMGMKRNQAIKMVIILWLLSLTGLVVGVCIGSIHEVSPWIYSFTAGVFLYLALVDLLSELSINGSDVCGVASQMALQVAGMMTGALIMLVIAMYEHDLETLLEGIL